MPTSVTVATTGDTVVATVAEISIKKKSLFLHADMPGFFHGVVHGGYCISLASQSFYWFYGI